MNASNWGLVMRRMLRGSRRMLTLFLALAVVLTAGTAFARGSVRLKNSRPKEANGGWKLKFRIDYGSVPHLAHVPAIFSFKPKVQYERALTDESPKTPILMRKPLYGQPDINIPMDMGFADMSGKVFRVTKFSVRLTRARDFEAGEYELTIRLSSGGTLGRKQKIVLQGQNEPVDRRSLVFVADSRPKKKKADDTKAEAEKRGGAAEDQGPDLSDIADSPTGADSALEEADAPPSVPPKQGGCGCSLPTSGHDRPAELIGLLGLLLVGAWRRRT